MQEVIKCRYAPSLGALEGTPYEAWGTPEYYWPADRSTPTVFFGLYDLRDYAALAAHSGKAWILWAGSDIRNLEAGFNFNDGKLKWLSKLLRGNGWVYPILQKAEHWVENLTEAEALERLGLKVSGVCPSYMGPVSLKTAFRRTRRPNVYLSASEGRQVEYGWDTIERIADKLPKFKFHLYGADWSTEQKNVIVHGRVPKEQMNREIEGYQIGARLNTFDGFSEVLAKALLMGQYVVGTVHHPFVPVVRSDEEFVEVLGRLGDKREPNHRAQEWYRKNLNALPWNVKKS